jgi:hypothetical protein
VLELGEAEYAVRATGYLKSLEDFRNVPAGLGAGGTPILLGDVARIQIGPEIRRGISELDGTGEVVGGVTRHRQHLLLGGTMKMRSGKHTGPQELAQIMDDDAHFQRPCGLR